MRTPSRASPLEEFEQVYLRNVDVPAGTDHVAFRFRGYGDYPALLALSGLALALVAAPSPAVSATRVPLG